MMQTWTIGRHPFLLCRKATECLNIIERVVETHLSSEIELHLMWGTCGTHGRALCFSQECQPYFASIGIEKL